jgi:trigger factor
VSNLGTKQQFSNENFSVDCTFKPGCIVDMLVKVSPQASQASFYRALKLLKKEVSLPGFRKGHVPDETVVHHFGAEVEKEAQRVLARTAFAEAAQLIGRPPFYDYGDRAIHLKKLVFSKDKGSELTFEYEAEPTIPSIEFDNLHLDLVEHKTPSMEEALALYDQLRHINAEKKPVNRPAQEGDSVSVHFVREGDQDSETSVRDFFLKPNLSPAWLISTVLGMSAGETKEISRPAEGLEDESLKAVKVACVSECVLPEENEEFASRFGGKTIEDLKEKMFRRLVFEAKTAAQERMRKKLRNELIRLYAFDLPQSLVESETESRFTPFWDIYTKKSSPQPGERESVRKEFLEEAKRFLTSSMLLRSIFSLVNPTCSQVEVFEELNHQSSLPMAQRTVYPGLDEKTLINRLALNVMLRKCEDYCIERKLGVSPPVLNAQEEPKVVAQ